MLSRFLFKSRHRRADAGDVDLIRSNQSLRIIDEASPSLLLVETDEATIAALRAALPDWRIEAETSVPSPETQRPPKRSTT